MSLPRPDHQATTTQVHVKLLSVENAKKDAEKMQHALLQLFSKVAEAEDSHRLYLDQKNYVEENYSDSAQKKCMSLFAEDFADFKEKLNQAIREFNQFHKDYRFQLAILARSLGNPFIEQVVEIKKSLNQLKAYYHRDKELYIQLELAQHYPDIVRLPSTPSDSNNESYPVPSPCMRK